MYKEIISVEVLESAYTEMLLMRRFEEKVGQLYSMGLIGGFCHLYIGQEAIASGICKNLISGDTVITSYRDHGLMLALGCDPNTIMAELLGKGEGCSKGKGGSMHLFDVEKGFYGGHGIVGAQVPLGTGLAFGMKYKERNNISITIFGDGAVNQGQIYESFNMAKLWNLPIIYIIENNGYSMGTSVFRACSNPDTLYKRSTAFGIPSSQIDGMDFITVYHAMQSSVNYVRAGNGPVLIEMKTYRYRGHSVSDPAKYRTKEEVESYKLLDPIEKLKIHMQTNAKIDDNKIEMIAAKVKNIVQQSVNFAQNGLEPNINELYTDILI